MNEPAFIVGAARTDFLRNLRKEGRSLRHLIIESGAAALKDAGIDPGTIEAAVVGNFASGLFTRQLHLGALVTEIDSALRGIPTMHVEAACASGAVAVLEGAQQIMAGLRDVVLVIGAEQQKTMSPLEGGDVLGAAADYEEERSGYGDFLFPKLFAEIARRYAGRYGLRKETLAAIVAKNHAHGALNPLAQMRSNPVSFETAASEGDGNPVIASPLKTSDCSQITDGAAALVLCSQRFLQWLKPHHASRLIGYGHTTDHLALEQKDVPDFSVAANAASQAYAMAGIGPGDLNGAEVHDCFSISELVQYELLGFADPGAGAELLESGATTLPSNRKSIRDRSATAGAAAQFRCAVRDLPVNAGGGLLADGHPVGATGVRQVVEAHQQLAGLTGDRQITGAERFLTCNIGGTFTTTVVMIWEKAGPKT